MSERGSCWKGYKQAGMKKKGNRMVPNCVPAMSSGGLNKWFNEKWVDIDRESAFDLYMTVPQFRGQALTFILNPKNYFRG